MNFLGVDMIFIVWKTFKFFKLNCFLLYGLPDLWKVVDLVLLVPLSVVKDCKLLWDLISLVEPHLQWPSEWLNVNQISLPSFHLMTISWPLGRNGLPPRGSRIELFPLPWLPITREGEGVSLGLGDILQLGQGVHQNIKGWTFSRHLAGRIQSVTLEISQHWSPWSFFFCTLHKLSSWCFCFIFK